MGINKILSVDDDPMIRKLIKTILEASSYEVMQASNGTEAIDLLDSSECQKNEFSCIILDVQMPDMSGFDLLTRLQLHNKTSDIPVIMLTSQSSTEEVMTGYSGGAQYYITKPFTREQLLFGVDMVTK